MPDGRGLRDACASVGVGVGVGQTAYTRGTDASTLELHLEASLAALADAGLTPADVDAVMPNDVAERYSEEFMLNLGLRDLAQVPMLVSGLGEGHGNPPSSLTQKPDITFIEGMQTAGQRAFRMAGLGPGDIDCAQLYDGFTWFVLGSLEALGFCGRGESGPFVSGGRIEIGGELPDNTHGGLLSEAHVSGVNHYIEAVRQLRRQVEPDRQVEGCETVLVTSEGDMYEGSVAILRR